MTYQNVQSQPATKGLPLRGEGSSLSREGILEVELRKEHPSQKAALGTHPEVQHEEDTREGSRAIPVQMTPVETQEPLPRLGSLTPERKRFYATAKRSVIVPQDATTLPGGVKQSPRTPSVGNPTEFDATLEAERGQAGMKLCRIQRELMHLLADPDQASEHTLRFRATEISNFIQKLFGVAGSDVIWWALLDFPELRKEIDLRMLYQVIYPTLQEDLKELPGFGEAHTVVDGSATLGRVIYSATWRGHKAALIMFTREGRMLDTICSLGCHDAAVAGGAMKPRETFRFVNLEGETVYCLVASNCYPTSCEDWFLAQTDSFTFAKGMVRILLLRVSADLNHQRGFRSRAIRCKSTNAADLPQLVSPISSLVKEPTIQGQGISSKYLARLMRFAEEEPLPQAAARTLSDRQRFIDLNRERIDHLSTIIANYLPEVTQRLSPPHRFGMDRVTRLSEEGKAMTKAFCNWLDRKQRLTSFGTGSESNTAAEVLSFSTETAWEYFLDGS